MNKDIATKAKDTRLHALDGLRGVAILLVLLSHVNATIIHRNTFWEGVIFNNGILGVSFLFLLSGFLMAYLYPHPPSAFGFLKKRYTRIFPLFITVSLSIASLSLLGHFSDWLPVGILTLGAFVVHILWVYGVKKMKKPLLSNVLFILFLFMQVASIIICLWVMHHPAVYYYDQLTTMQRTLLVGLANSTLTLPFGIYIPMLDPVYWSLIAEILFYILYIFICVPVINYFTPKHRILKLCLIITLLPFFAGITLLLQDIFHFSLIRFQLFYFFIGGMSTAYLYRRHPEFIYKIGNIFPKRWSVLSIIFFFALMIIDRQYFSQTQSIVNQLCLAVFTTILFYFVLTPTTLLAKVLSSRVMVFIGMISYSMYLSHMTVFNLMHSLIGEPSNFIFLLLYIVGIIACTTVFSFLLYYLLEKPYFLKHHGEQKVSPSLLPDYAKRAKVVLGGICVVYLLTIIIVYQSEINFFSIEQRYSKSVFIAPKIEKNEPYISMRDYPKVTLVLPAEFNDLGLIHVYLDREVVRRGKIVPQQITFKIKEKGAQDWYSISHYPLTQRNQVLPEVYGFPKIHDAKGKTYIIELSMDNAQSTVFGLLDTKDNTVKSIYEIEKKDLLHDKSLLFHFINNKIEKIIYNPLVQNITLLFIPFFVLIMLTFLLEKRIHTKK